MKYQLTTLQQETWESATRGSAGARWRFYPEKEEKLQTPIRLHHFSSHEMVSTIKGMHAVATFWIRELDIADEHLEDINKWQSDQLLELMVWNRFTFGLPGESFSIERKISDAGPLCKYWSASWAPLSACLTCRTARGCVQVWSPPAWVSVTLSLWLSMKLSKSSAWQKK